MLNNKIKIVPSVLTDNPEALAKMLCESDKFTDFVQIDIMDGIFVQSTSISINDITKIKTSLRWEAHLMVKNPEKYIQAFAKAGVEQIIFHYEATYSPDKLIGLIHNLGVKAGMAINPDTPISVIYPVADKVDSILFMSVIPGFYGSKFIPEVIDKIKDLRRIYPEMPLSIDGGIKENNISLIAKTGVNSICVGSAIFCQDNMSESYKRLEDLSNVS